MRKILTLLIALAVCHATMAQALFDTKMQNLAGANYYYTMNTVGCDTFGINKITYMEPGYGFGVAYKHFELAKIIGLQAEVNYERQGFTMKPTDELYYTQMYKYISVPIYAHVDIGKHAVKGIFGIGTYGQFLIDREKTKTNISYYDTSSLNRIYHGKYRTFSYGLCGQAGIAICTKAGVIEILGRANIGMSKLMNMGELRLFNYMSSRSFGMGISYMVPFGKGEKYYTRREKKHKKEKEETDNNTSPAPPETEEPDNKEEIKEDPDTTPTTPESNDENWEDRMND